MNRAGLSSEPAAARRSAFTARAECGKEVERLRVPCPRKAVGMAPRSPARPVPRLLMSRRLPFLTLLVLAAVVSPIHAQPGYGTMRESVEPPLADNPKAEEIVR